MTAIGATAVVVTAVRNDLKRSETSDLPSFSDDPCFLGFPQLLFLFKNKVNTKLHCIDILHNKVIQT